jgi:hypothetical protein
MAERTTKLVRVLILVSYNPRKKSIYIYIYIYIERERERERERECALQNLTRQKEAHGKAKIRDEYFKIIF